MFARQNHHPHPSQEPFHLLELKLGIRWTIRRHSSPPSAPGDHCLTFCLWMCLACFYVQFRLQHARLTLWQSESVHIYVFFSKMIYHRVLHIVPCVLYQGLVAYPFFFGVFSSSESRSVVSDSLQPHGRCHPWNSPGQNTGVGSLALLQGILPTQGWNPGLPHCMQILYQLSHQANPRMPELVAYPFSSGSFRSHR